MRHVPPNVVSIKKVNLCKIVDIDKHFMPLFPMMDLAMETSNIKKVHKFAFNVKKSVK